MRFDFGVDNATSLVTPDNGLSIRFMHGTYAIAALFWLGFLTSLEARLGTDYV